jgi:hypothetical protein
MKTLGATKESLRITNDEALHKTMATLAAQNLKGLVVLDGLVDVMGDFGANVLRKDNVHYQWVVHFLARRAPQPNIAKQPNMPRTKDPEKQARVILALEALKRD